MVQNYEKPIPYGENFMKKGVNDRLYAHLQLLSYTDGTKTFVYKDSIKDKYTEIGVKLGISRQKVSRDLSKLIKLGFIKKDKVVGLSGNYVEAYVFVLGELNPFKLIPSETLKHLIEGTNGNVVKLYVYLLNKWQWKGSEYTFTYKEIVSNCLGLSPHSFNNDTARILLNILYKLGLIDFCQYINQNQRNEFKLIEVNLNFDVKLMKEEEKVAKIGYKKRS